MIFQAPEKGHGGNLTHLNFKVGAWLADRFDWRWEILAKKNRTTKTWAR